MSRGFRSLVGIVALISAVLFTAVAAGQYWFLSHQLRQQTTDDLKTMSEDLRDDIAFSDAWNLEGYRRITSAPEIYFVLTSNGTLVDLHGYQGMLPKVSFPFRFEYDRPFQFTSDIGEKWNLYVHRLRDGLVILGVREAMTPPNINERFAKSAARFGSSAADATKTPERAIDEAFDFAIIDSDGTLRWGISGIPLKTAAPNIPDRAMLTPVQLLNGNLYSSFIEPVTSKSGQKVGLIRVFEDVTDEQRVLHQSLLFNVIIAVVLWSLTVGAVSMYFKRARPSQISCAQIPFLEESETVEFKSSLRWDYVQQRTTKEAERTVAKAVVGFLNSENGGTLIIGISDRKEVLGLDLDYLTFKSAKLDLRPTGRKPAARSDRDVFEQVLRQILINIVGERHCARWIKLRFCSLQGKDICIVTVAPASEPVFLTEEGGGKLYIRVGNSTRPFGVQEALAYAGDRWAAPTLRRFHLRSSAPLPAG
ncbi:MAG TPA: ATP-binding protein [Candidatus Binataceae bacterium]|nr:ATP-binding protein [Candidatus Binataceae bacterium]